MMSNLADQPMESELEALRRRLAELEARAAELWTVLDSTPQPVLIHTDRPLYCNGAAARLFGYDSPAELLALPDMRALQVPEMHDVIAERCQQRLRGEDVPDCYEAQAVRKDGSRLWLHVAAQRITWEGRVAAHCVYTDISARKRADEDLVRFRRMMREALNALPLWIAVKDANGRFLMANEHLAATYRRHSKEMEGLTAREVGTRHPATLEQAEAIDRNVLTQGTTVDLPDFKVILPDGSEQIRHLIKTPLRDDEQRIIGLVGVSTDVTEHQRAQESLRASQRLLETVVNSLPLWLMVKDREGHCLLTNQAMADDLGMTPQALVGTTAEETGPRLAEERALVRRTDRVVVETGQPVNAPASPYTLPDGREQIRDLYKFPLFDDEGGVTGLVSVSVDVTARVKAERQHEADWRLLQNVVDTMPHFVFVKDREGHYLLMNRAMADGFGVAPGTLLGKTSETMGVSTPVDRARFAERDRLVWTTGARVDDTDFDVTLSDGREHVLHLVKVPLRDEFGAVVGLVGVAEDITERQEAQEALGAQRRLLQAVFDTIPAWLFVKDREGRFLMVNDTLAREVGLPTAKFQGLPHNEAPQGKPEQRARIRRREALLVADGVPQEDVEELTLPDGRLTLRHTRKVALRDERGAITGVVGISQDITEQRHLEEQMRRMQRMEAIGTLAGGIAHDFNNILFPIIGFTELTMRELDPESTAHHNLSIVRDAAFRAKDIVAQILTFSRRSDNKPEVMQLRPLVRESLRFLRSTLPRTVEVEELVAKDVVYVHADAVQMHQVLMNLCVNAAHAMPEGGTLRVRLHKAELDNFRGYTGAPATGRYVCLSVADSGVGIEPEALSRIFEPFYTTKPVGQGTGLGLSTVLGIITQHDGVVDVQSVPGRGSCFSVYLPAVPSPVPEAGPDGAPAQAQGNATVLFVDDEWAVTELATHVLEGWGYRVMSFTSSLTALHAFESDPAGFDLVVTDQMMPELTGDKLVQAIRAVRDDVPILLGTGFSDVITPEAARALGIVEVFHKPITPDGLVAVVQRALAGRGEVTASGAAQRPSDPGA